jgi:glutamine synthetase
MTTKEILQYVKEHPSGKVKIAVSDIDGILRGKYISAEKFSSVIENGLGFCNVIFGWDAADVVYDNVEYTGWHTGYPDSHCVLDINTFRKIPWENDVPFFLGELADEKGNTSSICPRQLLKKIVNDTNELGYTPFFRRNLSGTILPKHLKH